MRRLPFFAAIVLSTAAACGDLFPALLEGLDASSEATGSALWTLDQPYADLGNLHGVWGAAADDVWAVGDKGVILHFNGSSWKKVPSPTTQPLYAIDGVEDVEGNDADIYAVGGSGTIIHWDGVAWAPEPKVINIISASGATVESALMGVWHGGDEGVFVVGANGTILAKRRAASDPPDAPGTWGMMYEEMIQDRIPVCETRVAYAFGGYPQAGDGGFCAPCMIAPPEGDTSLPMTMWTCDSVNGTDPVPYCNGPEIRARPSLCELPASMWQGTSAQCSFGQRCMPDGTTPMYQVTLYRVDFKAIIGYGRGANLRLIAVGESGSILELRPPDQCWSCEGTDPAVSLGLCWQPYTRTLDFCSGEGDSASNFIVRDTLSGLFGTGPSDVFAVGEDGRVLWRNGDSLKRWVRGGDPTQPEYIRDDLLAQVTPVFLRGVWHQGANDIFAVGYSGIVLHHTDQGWAVEEVPTRAHLRAVWGITRTDLDAGVRDAAAPPLRTVVIVGSNGVILRRAVAR